VGFPFACSPILPPYFRIIPLNTEVSLNPGLLKRGFLKPLGDLQSAINLESFWRANLRLLRSVMPHHSCSLMVGIVDYEPQTGRHHVVEESQGASQPVTSLSISKSYLAAHPRIKLYTYTEIVREDPQAHQRRLEREQRFWGWSQFLHLAFWNGAHPEAVLSIRRSESQGDFLEEERDFLAELYPMIDAGLRRVRLLERERGRTEGMERFLSTLPLPIMFLDGEGKLGFATPEAYDLCAAWNYGFKEARSVNTRRCFRMPAEISEACDRLASSLFGANGFGGAGGVESARVQHPFIPRLIAKVDVNQPLSGSPVSAGFWVTLSSEQNLDGANAELKTEALQRLRLLTPCERRVALLVAEGCHNHDVAKRLGKSPRTVEFQLNMIYKKLCVSGRTELAHVLS
jgi:DNA-binding CsgD family transcriptional regulator